MQKVKTPEAEEASLKKNSETLTIPEFLKKYTSNYLCTTVLILLA